jgi:hypothetical protein
MACREVTMVEIKEVVRLWRADIKKKRIALHEIDHLRDRADPGRGFRTQRDRQGQSRPLPSTICMAGSARDVPMRLAPVRAIRRRGAA